ncbi:hypothetical protein NBRC10512_006832 [Rhodotorula toruloides]|uniref:Probable RNA-binding protein 18 n=2 Tax=Rhodotorula toruloides TaxID=5286 RepID=A0A061ADN9_RHOTO|nr:single-stranded nucleic acid binding protein [Rhodotorula toruloides NP11]EMS21828.1 single-stranded nucleic acid binding protein [Rhodotorula toruloides NP11]CDR35682.1 RHTO0S01e04786g1_1 [Rhodotorula toruloides]
MAATTTQSEKRLYIGNLATSVDEYSLMQVCAKYGKIAKLDYLFHKTGPNKGKPRGYAFVEYSMREEAQRAMQALHDKLFRGRKMVVSLASEQQDTTFLGTKKPRGPMSSDAHKPTAISLLKGTGVGKAPTNRKIAALEAKLAAMRQSKEGASPTGSESSPGGSSTPSGTASASGTAEIDPVKAGLPARPYFESQEAPREM